MPQVVARVFGVGNVMVVMTIVFSYSGKDENNNGMILDSQLHGFNHSYFIPHTCFSFSACALRDLFTTSILHIELLRRKENNGVNNPVKIFGE